MPPPLSKKKILRWPMLISTATASGLRPGRSDPGRFHERWIDRQRFAPCLRRLQGVILVKLARQETRSAPLPPPSLLSPEQILVWAELHYERTGRWPKTVLGPSSTRLGKPGPRWTEPCALGNVAF